jgi:hypothetical protein
LHETVAYELELSALGIDRRLILKRPVSVVEHDVRGDLVAAYGLDRVAIGRNLSVRCADHEKAMETAFGIANVDRLRRHQARPEQQGAHKSSPEPLGLERWLKTLPS